jgi:peptidoglycan/xylan/chitin deacetylase (PgdA/CDA1 family)
MLVTRGFKLSAAALACGMVVAGCSEARKVARRSEEEAGRRHGSGTPEIVWKVATKEKVVALTFDDGPDPRYTPQVLRLARKKGLKLTFFLVGREIQLHPALAREEVAEGHVIGNHTWDHPTMTYDTERQDISEIERCEGEIEKVCGERTYLFRPPKGMWDGDTFLAALAAGYRMILWSVALEHHTAKTPHAMAERVVRKIRPGMIILAHDGEPCHPVDREKTMKALPILVDALQKRGYRFLTVPELLTLAHSRLGGVSTCGNPDRWMETRSCRRRCTGAGGHGAGQER